MRGELLPDTLKKLWQDVEDKRLSREEFHQHQDRLLGEYRGDWEKALLLNGHTDLRQSILSEICSYLGKQDLCEVETLCSRALADIRGEWHEKVVSVDEKSVETFYDKSEGMLYELMWWHTLIDDLSPLAYVVALKFAGQHGCKSYLDFGSGVGSGGILFARSGISVTLADISSTALNFSSWRFAKRNLQARHIDLKEDRLTENGFDFITAMDVFEHLVDPTRTVRTLWAALKQGGFLFGRFHAEFDADRPHHIILDFEPTLKELESAGFVKVWQDEWLWGHQVYQKL
jgi:mycofactocin glycosyltransferase